MNSAPSDPGTLPYDVLVVLCTVPNLDVATELARGLVREGLAACVNVIPEIRSFYVWDGQLCEEGEAQLVIKTRSSHWDMLQTWIAEHHPYEVPELIGLPPTQVSQSYLDWLLIQTER